MAARALALALALALSGVPAAHATTPEVSLSYLNQQRAAYGIPPVDLDQSLLKPQCNFENHEIASPRTSWSGSSSPWDEAPYHELILYDPANVAGSYGEYEGFGSESGTWACMWFAQDWDANPGFYWSAEASGPEAVPPSLSAFEAPSSPAEDAGLVNPTGPNLAVYAQGLAGEPVPFSASVTSPAGEAEPVHLVPFTGRSAVVVVDRPLASATTYRAEVHWRSASAEEGEAQDEYVQRFTFTTSLGPPRQLHPHLALRRSRARPRLVWVESDALLRGRAVGLSLRVRQWRCRAGRGTVRCRWRRVRSSSRSLVLAQDRMAVRLPRLRRGRSIVVSVRSPSFSADGAEVLRAFDRLTVR